MVKIFIVLSLFIQITICKAQLTVSSGGSIVIDAGAIINVQGNVTCNAAITGTGKVVISGTNSKLNTNDFAINNLEINSTANVTLEGISRVSGLLNFVSGKLQLGDHYFTLANTASVTGTTANTYIETNGSGVLRKEVNTTGTYTLPLGTNNTLLLLTYTIVGGSFSPSAYVAGQLLNATHPNKPVRSDDFLNQYWKSSNAGITGATINASTTYNDLVGVTGNEIGLSGLQWDGVTWSSANSSIDNGTNSILFNNLNSGVDLFAMNKFILAKSKVFLQGAYNAGTGLMADNLRTAPCLIPTSDPYRTAPYNITAFTHFNNTITETVNPSVFTTQLITNNNIVDWVFLELRNASNVLLQTRSALLQRDGDIVDVDGVSAVFFKNMDPGNYILTVRHRNHLGIGADATTYTKSLNLSEPALSSIFDFTTTSDAQMFGAATAYTTASHPTNGSVNLLWGGNSNSNINTRYTGLQNDKDYILVTTLSNSSSTVLLNVYSPADINMNRNVRFNGLANDKDFLYISVLGSNTTTQRIQSIPN